MPTSLRSDRRLLLMARGSRSMGAGGSMPFEEDVVLPAAHAQQHFAYERDMLPIVGIDGDVGGDAERNLTAADVSGDVDEGQGPAGGCALRKIDERSRRLDLAGGDGVQDLADVALEHAAGHGGERDRGLVAGLDPLQ